jgi:serine/threonine protein kinase
MHSSSTAAHGQAPQGAGPRPSPPPLPTALRCTAAQKYRYERLQELGSGSYAVVYKARNRETDEVIALKKLRFGFDEQGLPSSTLREISLLKELKHANIVE